MRHNGHNGSPPERQPAIERRSALHALLLAQPLNELQPLSFRELPSRDDSAVRREAEGRVAVNAEAIAE